MMYNSRYNIGDKIWVPLNNVPTLVTVGKITIEHTDSPGRPGEELFDNYKPQRKYKEHYMCVETGIGTGTNWERGWNIFDTEEDCQYFINDRLGLPQKLEKA